MTNYQIGRYYGWQNLSRLIKATLRKYGGGPKYEFKYVPPKTSIRAQIVPFEEWKGSTFDAYHSSIA
jgi:hypothetical protein